MNSGITRKIDDLGRVVIPKEIRKNLGIREGENLEVLIDNDAIILKKYSKIKKDNNLSDKLCYIVSNIYDMNVLITDREKVISASKEELKEITLDEELIRIMDERIFYESEINENILGMEGYYSIAPVIDESSVVGSIILVGDKKDINLAKFMAVILLGEV